ncbi:OprD family outer membrane porin [Azotobacter salinestris]|nr:OprD family outer membrane porin [Azotobacter salinestris]
MDLIDYRVPGLSWKAGFVHSNRIDTGRSGMTNEREFHDQPRNRGPADAARDLSSNLYGSIYRTRCDLNEIRLFVEYPLDLL